MIHFLSPLPPKKTGTADYIIQLLNSLKKQIGPEILNNIVLWDKFERREHIESLIQQGYKVDDIRNASFNESDHVFMFLASNDYHRWVWTYLARKVSPNIISVIHDLTAFPMLRSMACDENSGFTKEDELLALQYEFGIQASWMVDNYEYLPSISKYFLMGQGITLNNSKLIVVHSNYAKLRLISESVRGLSLPDFKVFSHPEIECNIDIDLARSYKPDLFCIGSVGFYSDIKRNDVLIEAFYIFLKKLPQNMQSKVCLVFVGSIDDYNSYIVNSRIKDLGLSDHIDFTGYVSESELQAWQHRLDLQFNLRFPSCGETSGTLARAHSMNKKVVCSSFAAFNEEYATYKVDVDTMLEIPQLLEILNVEFLNWQNSVDKIEKQVVNRKNQFYELILDLSK